MVRRLRSVAVNLLLALASTAVVLGSAEAFLRLFPRFLPPEAALRLHWMRQPTPLSRADPYTGFVYPANYIGHFRAGNFQFDYTTDERGFRNRGPWPDSAEVVIVGDSQAFGYGVGDDSTWSSLLARGLSRSRVINLGLPGMSPKQYLRAYQRFGVGLRPKIVLFGLFPGNDVEDEREFNAWLEAGSPGNFGTWKYRHGIKPSLTRRILDRIYLYWTVREVARGLRGFESAPAMTFPDGSRIRFTPKLQERQAAITEPNNPSFQSAIKSIEEAQALARDHGAAFVVLIFPTKEEVYFPLRGDSVPPITPPFLHALAAAGIRYLDLTVPLQAEARQQKRLFFEVDGHPNETGYQVIAEAVLAYFRQHAEEFGLADW